MRQVLRSVAKKTAFALLANPFRLRQRLDRLQQLGGITILNLHRVSADDGSDYRPLDPLLFDELLAFVDREFELRTFATLDEPSKRPRMILSFDDGYLDFFEEAMPRLERRNIRVNHNIIPGCTERGEPPLNVMVQDFVGRAPADAVGRLEVPGFGRRVAKNCGSALSHFLKMRPMESQEEYRKILLPQFSNLAPGFEPTKMMSIDQLRTVAEVHEIGAHSYDHASMGFETLDYLARDLERCKEWFRDKLDLAVSIYAFPNGSVAPGQAELLLENGITSVLLVEEKFSAARHQHHRFTLDGRSVKEVKYKAVGGRTSIDGRAT